MRTQRAPGGDDSEWADVLAHRAGDAEAWRQVRDRFRANGLTPSEVDGVLQDDGAGLAAAAASGDVDWTAPFGGALCVALLSAEVAARSAYLVARAAAVRSLAVEHLMEDFSAIAVADQLGLSRQKVYEIARDTPQRRSALESVRQMQMQGVRP